MESLDGSLQQRPRVRRAKGCTFAICSSKVLENMSLRRGTRGLASKPSAHRGWAHVGKLMREGMKVAGLSWRTPPCR